MAEITGQHTRLEHPDLSGISIILYEILNSDNPRGAVLRLENSCTDKPFRITRNAIAGKRIANEGQTRYLRSLDEASNSVKKKKKIVKRWKLENLRYSRYWQILNTSDRKKKFFNFVNEKFRSRYELRIWKEIFEDLRIEQNSIIVLSKFKDEGT